MADKKISQLSGASTPLAGTEVLPIVQSGSTVKVSVDNLTAGKTVSASAFNSSAGYQFRGADNTAYETLRYVGGTNNPGLFTSVVEASKKVRLNATGSIAAGHELCLGAEGTQDVFKVGAANVTVSTGNLIFGGTAQRITGDMSNATVANRMAFQTSTLNGNTTVNFLPNGTATVAQFFAYNNSDPTNASNGGIVATSTAMRVSSGQTGSGSYLPLALYTNGAEQVTVGTDSNVTVKSGNLVVGTAAKGIDFSANTGAAGMTSELLNWYEEGTWTPVPTSLTVVGTPTYTGFYTRIGRAVYWTARIQSTTSTTSTAGTTVFAGFPFVSSSATYVFTAINNATIATLGNGAITVSGGNTTAYAPSWTALADVVLTGFYTV